MVGGLRKIKLKIKSLLVWWRAKLRFIFYYYVLKDFRDLRKFFVSYQPTNKVCFIFSSKDRLNFTKKSLETIDYCSGFDVLWIDGSESRESLDFFNNFKPKNFNIMARISNISGGPDVVILLGLKLLLRSQYDYIGFLENDVYLKLGWFDIIMGLFGTNVGIEGIKEVGAVSLRNYKARNFKILSNYSLAWNLGAGMTLFTKEAANIIFKNYEYIFSFKLRNFFFKRFGIKLEEYYDPLYPVMFQYDLPLSGDTKFCFNIWKHNLACIASVPSFAYDLDFNKPELYL